jgi:predicted DNA-binding protein with PD1-like motif
VKRLELLISPDETLFEGVVAGLENADTDSAVVNLMPGQLQEMTVFTGQPDPRAGVVGKFSDPNHVRGPFNLLCGAMTIGCGENKAPFVHCHGVYVDPETHELRGGHIVADTARVFGAPISVWMFLLPAGFLQLQDDIETGFKNLKPQQIVCAVNK